MEAGPGTVIISWPPKATHSYGGGSREPWASVGTHKRATHAPTYRGGTDNSSCARASPGLPPNSSPTTLARRQCNLFKSTLPASAVTNRPWDTQTLTSVKQIAGHVKQFE
ncbi:hypothetical protein CBL_00901 [Carabus blaptoides fortunei]